MAMNDAGGRPVAALFVAPDGAYAGLAGVDAWTRDRDARLYDGSGPVVAHPPCARWSRLARLNESRYGLPVGADDGCFAAAVAAVRRCGGVLEHPAGSLAWNAFGFLAPRGGGWQRAGIDRPGWWTAEVNQGQYGHVGRKPTWLLTCGVDPDDLPSLDWGRGGLSRAGGGRVSALRETWTNGRGGVIRGGAVEAMTRRERLWTPPAFRDALIAIARSARASRWR